MIGVEVDRGERDSAGGVEREQEILAGGVGGRGLEVGEPLHPADEGALARMAVFGLGQHAWRTQWAGRGAERQGGMVL